MGSVIGRNHFKYSCDNLTRSLDIMLSCTQTDFAPIHPRPSKRLDLTLIEENAKGISWLGSHPLRVIPFSRKRNCIGCLRRKDRAVIRDLHFPNAYCQLVRCSTKIFFLYSKGATWTLFNILMKKKKNTITTLLCRLKFMMLTYNFVVTQKK